MPQLIFKNDYVIVSRIFKESEKHSHLMMQIFIGDANNVVMVEGKAYSGRIIITNQNVEHYIKTRDQCSAFLLVKPTSLLAKYIKSNYIKDEAAITINDIDFEKIAQEDCKEVLERKILAILKALGIKEQASVKNEQMILDERIRRLIQEIQAGKYFNHSIQDIAKVYHLSEGRMAHLFKDEAGISLMSYIQLMQLEYVYREVIKGKSVTEAALEAGFNSSSHFAYVCKKITGISISKVMRIAGF